jgi:hypothetical protein
MFSESLEILSCSAVEAVGLWDAGLIAFQALARQIHSLLLVLPMLLPGLLRRRAGGVSWSGYPQRRSAVPHPTSTDGPGS